MCCSESSVRMLASTQRQVYVVRDGSLRSRVSVRCQSLGGSAVALTDYLPVYSTPLVFDVGVRWHTVNLTTLNAGKPVPDLSFQLVLFAAQGTCVRDSKLLTLILSTFLLIFLFLRSMVKPQRAEESCMTSGCGSAECITQNLYRCRTHCIVSYSDSGHRLTASKFTSL